MCVGKLFSPPSINLPPIPTPQAATPVAPVGKAQLSSASKTAGQKDAAGRFKNPKDITQMSDLLGLAVPKSSLGLLVPGGNI